MSKVNLAYGITTDSRTAAMLKEAQRISGVTFEYAQGSYNGTNVAASAGTHAGGGVVDIRTIPMGSWARKRRATACLRRVGFAAWIRPYVPKLWGEHIHAVAVGCADSSWGAQNQVRDYQKGLNGLANKGADPHLSWGISPTTWERYKAQPRVEWSKLGRGKPVSEDVKVVQRALNKYLGTRLLIDGKWGPATSRAWARAVVKSGRRGFTLLRHLSFKYLFRAYR